MIDPEKVKEFMLALVKAPELQPTNGKTFCNIAARRVAQFFGCHDFDAPNLLADEMIWILLGSTYWIKTMDGEVAAAFAQSGNLAFAVMSSERLGDDHGHIAAVFPAQCELSPSLGHPVPLLANVGKTCGITKESLDFPVAKGEADYFLWKL